MEIELVLDASSRNDATDEAGDGRCIWYAVEADVGLVEVEADAEWG